MEHKNVGVQISPGTGGGYCVRLESEQGTINYKLTLPFAPSDLAGVLPGVGCSSRDMGPAGYRPTDAKVQSAREIGERLYEALFPEHARVKLAETRTAAREAAGIRIRLSMDLRGDGMAEVAGLPWELLCPRDERPLALSTRTLLVRSLDVSKPTDPPPFSTPLRVLTVLCNPKGTAQLDLEKERASIENNWARLPGVRVDFLAPENPIGSRPVRPDLQKQLAEADYHVVHFMGHGDFDPAKGGMLLLQHEDGSPDPVTSEELAVMMGDEPIRLFFLNACKTAMIGAKAGPHPFAGLATSLIRDGVPAVVAMQFPISDDAAINFAQTFYQRIAQRHPVDAAVAEGRKALYSSRNAEWATPVLFLRSKDGVLFQPAANAEPEAPNPTLGAPAPAMANDQWGPATGDAFRVFLAATTEALRPVHRQLSGELASSGIRVASFVPPPYEPEPHARAVQSLVRAADLSVHILGDRAGEPIDDTTTFPEAQLRIGLEAASSQLVLVPDDVDIGTIEDGQYVALLRDLVSRPRDSSRFELVRTNRHRMKDAILEKRHRLEQARQAQQQEASGGPVRTAFVDLHSKDLSKAQELITYLEQKGIESILRPSGDSSPAEALKRFQETLSKSPLYLVVFGSVTREWVLSRLNQAVQCVSENAGATTCFGVYLAPPEKDAEQVKFARLFQKAANMSRFDPKSIDALIARAAE